MHFVLLWLLNKSLNKNKKRKIVKYLLFILFNIYVYLKALFLYLRNNILFINSYLKNNMLFINLNYLDKLY